MMVLILLLVASVTLAQVGDRTSQATMAPNVEVGTAFSYQGQLMDNDAPVNGDFDFEFRLFDQLQVGNQVGAVVTNEDVPVSDGLFTVDLDFGSDVFLGEARWLEIGVRPGTETGAYETLAPRQRIRATPYAMNADMLDGENASAFADAVHDHWGENWSGVNPGLALTGNAASDTMQLTNNGDGTALRAQSAAGNAVTVQSDSTDNTEAAVMAYSSQQANAVFAESTHGNGVVGNGGDGVNDYGGYFVGYAGVYGMGENAPGGYFESTSDDAVYADGDVTITGDLTVSGATDLPGYANVIIVAKSGGDFTSIQAALDSIDDASASNPYLIWVAPGIYTEQVIMESYVDIRGAGEWVTQISYTGHVDPYSATVEGADNAELSYLTVVNSGGDFHAVAIFNDATSPRLSHLTATASGGTTGNYGIYNYAGSTATIQYVNAAATGGSNSYGMYNDNASPTLHDVTLTASGAATNIGLSNNGSDTVLTNVRAKGSGGTINRGITNATSLSMSHVRLEGTGGSDNCGILNTASSGDHTVSINHSEIYGGTTIETESWFTTFVGASLLSGDSVAGDVTCAGVYDENYVFSADTCP
jgi:hypothetical protein